MRFRHPRIPHYDVVSSGTRESLDDDLARRRHGYFLLWVPCILLVIFGFFVPAPTPLRIAALAIAAPLLPIAAIVANARRR